MTDSLQSSLSGYINDHPNMSPEVFALLLNTSLYRIYPEYLWTFIVLTGGDVSITQECQDCQFMMQNGYGVLITYQDKNLAASAVASNETSSFDFSGINVDALDASSNSDTTALANSISSQFGDCN